MRLAGARTVGTLRGRLGRTVGAALDTVTDLRRQVLYEAFETGALPRRVGSLRGGFASLQGGGLRLRDARYVTGVHVSGLGAVERRPPASASAAAARCAARSP